MLRVLYVVQKNMTRVIERNNLLKLLVNGQCLVIDKLITLRQKWSTKYKIADPLLIYKILSQINRLISILLAAMTFVEGAIHTWKASQPTTKTWQISIVFNIFVTCASDTKDCFTPTRFNRYHIPSWKRLQS